MKKTKGDQNIGKDRMLYFVTTVVICSKDVSFHYNLIYYWMRICVFFERKKENQMFLHMVVLLLRFPWLFSFCL